MCGRRAQSPAAAGAEAGRTAGGRAGATRKTKATSEKAKQKTKTKEVVLLRDSGHTTAPALEEVSSSVLGARPVPVFAHDSVFKGT